MDSASASVCIKGQQGHSLRCQRLIGSNIGFNSYYAFNLDCASDSPFVEDNFKFVSLIITWRGGQLTYQAELLTFTQTIPAHGPMQLHLRYGCTLHRLMDTVNHRVYVKTSIATIIHDVFKDYHLSAVIDLKQGVDLPPYIEQGGVSDYDFFLRLCLEFGLIFYYLHDSNSSVLHISNEPRQGQLYTLLFNPYNGLVVDEGTVRSLHHQKISLPDSVHFIGQSDTTSSQCWKVMRSNETSTPGEGTLNIVHQSQLASREYCERASLQVLQQLDAQRECLFLEMTAMALQVGDIINIKNHPTLHESLFFQVISFDKSQVDSGLSSHPLRLQVVLIPADRPYRMPGSDTKASWDSQRAKPPLCWQQRIEAPEPSLSVASIVGNHNCPTLNQDGEYMIRPYFSQFFGTEHIWARMMQPAGGPKNVESQGMHIPLLPGTRVVVGHLHNQPMRPFILGVLPDEFQQSPVNSRNASQLVLRHSSGCGLIFDEFGNQQRLNLFAKEHQHGLFFETCDENESITALSLGEMTVSSQNTMMIDAAADVAIHGHHIRLYAEKELSLVANERLTFFARHQIQFNSDYGWQAQVVEGRLDFRCQKELKIFGNCVFLQAGELRLNSKYGDAMAKNSIVIDAGKKIQCQVVGSTLMISSTGIQIAAPQLNLMSPSILKH